MRHKVLTILAVASLCFSSCDDFLTEDVRGRQNLDTYFQSANDAQSFVTGCYQAITFGGWWNINTVWLMSEMCSDDGWMGNTTQSQSDYISLAHYQGSGQSNGAISNFWQYRYKGILRCNIAIDRIGKSNLADEQLKQRLIGEARFLRGYFYFELVRNFGGVPLVDAFKMPEEIAGENQFDKFVENSKNMAQYDVYLKEYGWDPDCYIIDPAQHKSARIVRKYFVPLEKRPEIYNIDRIPLDHRILRFADVLLMFAEASNELGKDTEAQEALNRVRHRVHLADVTATGNNLRKAIRLERRLELAWEQNRLYDIRRWKDDNGKPVIANLMGPNGSFVKFNTDPATRDRYEWENQGESSDKGITFDPDRDMVFPIPLYEITQSNGSIKQNPGWN